jgi:hypothetical protein
MFHNLLIYLVDNLFIYFVIHFIACSFLQLIKLCIQNLFLLIQMFKYLFPFT